MANHSIATMCRVVGLSTSGFYAWRKRKSSKRSLKDSRIYKLIVNVHRESRGTYSALRIHAELKLAFGIRCSKKLVARLIREAKLVSVHHKKLKECTRRNPARPSYSDLVKRSALIKHTLAVEAVMRHFAKKYGKENLVKQQVIGLIHDLDNEEYPEQCCHRAREILTNGDRP